MILDPSKKRCIILELKHVEKENDLETAADNATEQIIVNKYDSRVIAEGYETILRFGIAFWKKRCMIKNIDRCL